MCLNEYGTNIQNEWGKSFVICRGLLPDEFVVMPNHFHGIVRMVETKDRIGLNTVIVETFGRTSLQKTTPQPTDRQPKEFPRIYLKSVFGYRYRYIAPLARIANDTFNVFILNKNL